MSSPPPPSPPAEFSTSILSTLDLDFLNLAGLTALSLMIFYFIFACYERKYWNRRREIEARGLPQTVVQPEDAAAGTAAADSSVGDHGRRASMAVISTRLFQYGDRGMEGKNKDCSICLDEFSEGEVCRMLPKCKHIFHRFCIDKWLPTERHCPVCRSPVLVRIVYPHPHPS